MSKQEPVYLIDGSAYIYRAYHAVAPLTNSKGQPTHAVYGFTNILLRVLREKTPKYLAMVFDAKGPTFRHELYPEYKANRPPMPDDLISQLQLIRDVVKAYNITSLEQQGYEADDLIAAAATRLQKLGIPVIIVSGDKDLLQLVSETVTLWDPMNNRFMDPEAVQKKYNVPPEKLLDLYALIGDSSDNIPGVPGVGPKTAEKLINQFGSLESMYDQLDQVDKAKLKEKLLANKDQAFKSRDLIRLDIEVQTPTALDDYLIPAPDEQKLREIFTELEFTRLLKSETRSEALSTEGFQLVSSTAELDTLIKSIANAELLVLDTETSSLDPLVAELAGISLCIDAKEAFYLPMGHRDENGELFPGQLDYDQTINTLKPILENPDLPKLCHNLKYDYAVLKTHGITLAGPLLDTMIASYLLDPGRRSNKLDDLSEAILDRRLTPFAEVTEKDKRSDAFIYVPVDKAKDYSCEDVVATLLLWEVFKPKLKELHLWELFSDLEMPLVPILADMERSGINVDPALLADLSLEFSDKLAKLEQEIHTLAGEEFNINSPQQLGVILFDKLSLPLGRKTKTGYSTDVKVLEKLCTYHDLPAAVITHRNWSKLKSTYIDRLQSQIHPKTGRIHTSFNQGVTATGRLSSSNPNLQNIPIRTEEGQRIRQAFVPAQGKIFLAADYSQIDLRVFAHYSQDPALLKAFRSGQDIHSQTAAEIFRVNAAFISKEMRRVAKTINFGIVYGMSAFGLASQLNISRKEAGTFIKRYFEHFAGVKSFMEHIIEQARQDGFVTTLLHRRRLLPDINSKNKTLREFAERTAINTPIQGTAADIIKLATIKCVEAILAAGLSAKLLLQIHDELVFELPEKEAAGTGKIVKEVMESVMKLDVPLIVNLKTGTNLAET
ncbi:MAG: DNA polymerase I [Proteobacteria bacterium]|nr:DNA polymerase I [Pseudomonadota bacterium]